jgi:hypothetical protein
MEKLNRVWDFVEKYYPNYTGCSDIAYVDDLNKILNNELSGAAKELFETMKKEKAPWMSDEDIVEIIHQDIQSELDTIEHRILAKSIQGYINTL